MHDEMPLTDTDHKITIGIDLGTRFSCISTWRNKKLEIITDQYGNRTIPSVVSFYRSARLVGYNALDLKDVNPQNTIYDVKRIIGRRYYDSMIEQIKQLVSYKIIDDQTEHHNVLIQLDDQDPTIIQKRTYQPEEICAYILMELKRMAQQYFQKNVTKAIITVPAYFNDSQRQATLDAAKIAGLDVLKIINEPTAAAIAYGLGSLGLAKEKNVIIYDFGAGTLDVSLMRIANGEFRTLAVGGNSHLGGEDIDYIIMNHVLIDFQNKNNLKDIIVTKKMKSKLKNAVELAKKIVSSSEKSIICLNDFYMGQNLYYILSREFLETICQELFVLCIKPLGDVLESAHLSKNDINEVILVGGSSKIPKIRELILDFFKGTQIQTLNCSLNPDEVVSAGASIYSYIMMNHDDPFSQEIVLLDSTPLSLGVETTGGQMAVVIQRNTIIPTTKIKYFTTDTDGQTNVDIKIFEGERKLTKHNFHIGTFELTGFIKGPRGYPMIKISFHIDTNGILHVSALEKKSGIENSLSITAGWNAKGRLSKNEIDNIIVEAKKNEQIDTVYAVKVGIVHKIHYLCEVLELSIKNKEINFSKHDIKNIKKDIKTVKKIINKELYQLDLEELRKCERRLSHLYTPLIIFNKEKTHEEMTFGQTNEGIQMSSIYEDDQEINFQPFETIQKPFDSEAKDLKEMIYELGKNILFVINNPISGMVKEDVQYLNDYIESVNIWLFSTNRSSEDYLHKINEMNYLTNEIICKYDDNTLFNNNFHAKDELQMLCLTLHSSMKSNYFYLKKDDTSSLNQKISEILEWLNTHPNEETEVYQQKINEINEICNSAHQKINKKNNKGDNEESSDSELEIIEIDEKIDDIINQLPDDVEPSKTPPETERDPTKDVLWKINVQKLNEAILNG